MMKLKYCIVSANANAGYYEFVPIVCDIWKKLLDIEVIVIYIGHILPSELKQYESNIKMFEPIPNIHTAFQAQCIRLLYPSLLNTEDGVLVADIDMFPVRTEYYDGLNNIDDKHFIITQIFNKRKLAIAK